GLVPLDGDRSPDAGTERAARGAVADGDLEESPAVQHGDGLPGRHRVVRAGDAVEAASRDANRKAPARKGGERALVDVGRQVAEAVDGDHLSADRAAVAR